MLPEEEVLVESWKLAAGGISLKMTHIPTGVSVTGEPDQSKPYLKRLTELQLLLEQSVLEQNKSVEARKQESE